MIQTTYTNARANLAKLFDEVTLNQEVVVINRRGKDDVAGGEADHTLDPKQVVYAHGIGVGM